MCVGCVVCVCVCVCVQEDMYLLKHILVELLNNDFMNRYFFFLTYFKYYSSHKLHIVLHITLLRNVHIFLHIAYILSFT